MTYSAGTKLSHYEITSQIGKGGMGEVYQATDTKLGRAVAIKVLPEEFAGDSERIARFQREAKLLASLNHPNIAAIYGLEEAEGTRFLVMELIEGDTLSSRIKSGPIPIEEALKLSLQITEALEAAHEKGVIHRDLKPANIKVTPDGKVKVLDFGLAKAYAGDLGNINLSNSPTLSDMATQQGVILGTAAYMSPEQARGKLVDKRTDVWAFGVVLFEMLTGMQVFTGDTVSDTLASVLAREPEWQRLPANLHPRIRLLLERCLKKEPKNRYSDFGDARVDIQDVLTDPSGVLSSPIQTSEARKKLQVGISWIAVTAVLCLIIAGIVVWILKPVPPPERKQMVRFEFNLPEDQRITGMDVSPNGKQIVYSTDNGIYIRSVDELTAKLISGTKGYTVDPFFSPDSKSIGYLTRNEPSLKKVAVSGGTPVTLLKDIGPSRGASWNADNTILYGTVANGIMQISANGGNPEVAVKATSEVLLFPQMLPDGKAILYTNSNGISQVRAMVQSSRFGEPKELFAGYGARYFSPGYIIYVLPDTNNRTGNVYAVAFDPFKLEVKGEPFLLLQGTYEYAVSNAGTLVYVPQPAVAAETSPGTSFLKSTLVWMNREGKEEPLSAPSNWYHHPAISPDGTKVALSALIDLNLDIYIWDLAHETSLRRLTFEKGNDGLPIWTRDGKMIIFVSDREGNRSIYWKAANGTGEEEKLASVPGKNLFPECLSEDGKTLIVNEMDSTYTNSDIGIVSLEGDHSVKLLLKEPYMEAVSSISPDGKYMAYFSNEPGGAGFYVCPFPEVSKGKWQISGSDAEFVRWSPNGHELYYNTKDTIMAVSVETEPSFKPGKTRKLFSANLESGTGASPSWDISPDGKRFLIVKSSETPGAAPPASAPRKMVVVLNWFEELKGKAPVK